MKYLRLVFLSFVIAIMVSLLLSCANKNVKMTSPLEFEGEYLNNQVMLHALTQENTFKMTDTIVLRMTFKTDANIVFPNDYNLRLFVRDDETWKEINEKPRVRFPEGDFTFSPSTSHQLPVIFIEPELEDAQQKYLLRIYVSGDMMDGDEIKTVASYINVELRP